MKRIFNNIIYSLVCLSADWINKPDDIKRKRTIDMMHVAFFVTVMGILIAVLFWAISTFN